MASVSLMARFSQENKGNALLDIKILIDVWCQYTRPQSNKLFKDLYDLK